MSKPPPVTLSDNTHARCWGRGQRIEHPEHRAAILATKPRAREGQGRKRLVEVAPRMESLLQHWLEDGRNLGSLVARSLKLLDLYGEATFKEAVERLLDQGSHEYGALAMLCDQVLQPERLSRPVELAPHVQDAPVTPRDLGDYDE
ncbi:MAG: hypothetical protein AAFU79_25075 [Myxococcota bacterium]